MPGHGAVTTRSPTWPRTRRPRSSQTSAAVPGTGGVRVIRHAFEKHGRGAVKERRRDEHRAHEPAEVAEPEKPVPLADIVAVGEVARGLDQEPAVGEHGPLRPPRRPRRIDDEA